jgi:hypothetical protein
VKSLGGYQDLRLGRRDGECDTPFHESVVLLIGRRFHPACGQRGIVPCIEKRDPLPFKPLVTDYSIQHCPAKVYRIQTVQNVGTSHGSRRIG